MKFFSLFLLFCTHSQITSAAIPANLELTLVGNVSNNVGVRHAGDGSGRLFVINQTGIIRIIDNQGNLLATPFLNITNKVACCGERGLLGLAFHPDYANNGLFFVSYSKEANDATNGDSIIERYQVSSDPNVADANSAVQLMRVSQLASNHNGGNILFGPDGYLYIGLGDGGPQGNPGDEAQELNTLLGKMLRIDVDGSISGSNNICALEAANFGIPNDNPFVNDANVCDEIWSYGFRNPWRWSFDRTTGDLYIGDVGQSSIEEVSFEAANNPGGDNYGWRCYEGSSTYNQSNCTGNTADYVFPILEYNHSGGRCSITGGYMYRGPINSLNGQYIYGDYCSGQIWFATLQGSTWQEEEWNQNQVSFVFDLTSFGEDEQGNVYISKGGGNIYRLDLPNNDIIFANDFE